MPDLKEEFNLPSEGKEEVYGKKITSEYTIRAPRLSEKGIGDLTRKNKLQAEVLYKCLEPKPEIHPYDWHTGDYTAANLKQRIAARGKMMPLIVRCSNPNCKREERIEVDLDQVKITKPKLPFDLTYETSQGEKIELRFFTPHILDDIRINTEKYKKDYPEANHNISLQETVRAIVVSINGEKKPYSVMTNWIMNCYEVDLINMIDKATSNNFGPVLVQSFTCPECGKETLYSISPDNG